MVILSKISFKHSLKAFKNNVFNSSHKLFARSITTGKTMATPAKKAKVSGKEKPPSGETSAITPETLRKELEDDRKQCAESVLDFNFNKKRVKMLGAQEVPDDCKGVLYWMSRDQRVQGLQEVESECKKLNISFHLLLGKAVDRLPEFVKKNSIKAVVTDFSPLRTPASWVDEVKKALDKDLAFCQVDAHNIVPCWEASPKLEYGARTIRGKINNQLSTYLTKFPPVIKHPYKSEDPVEAVDWKKAEDSLDVDMKVGPVEWAKPGYSGAMITLASFLQKRLRTFNNDRNDPTKDSLSNLSPWFHFGQLAVQRAILCAQSYKKKYPDSVASFCEEAIVRRELADNFCFYNKKYDEVSGTNDWAVKTLDAHRKDKREYVYSCEEFEESKTHDDLWNSAQLQLVKNGKMHGFLRMYWAKKILEWTDSPERALKIALYLNDKYNLDGRDPNGYVGCMWSICGIHDQGWAERAVFGKIRYMNYKGCQRKFDVPLFVKQWGGKVHHKKKS